MYDCSIAMYINLGHVVFHPSGLFVSLVTDVLMPKLMYIAMLQSEIKLEFLLTRNCVKPLFNEDTTIDDPLYCPQVLCIGQHLLMQDILNPILAYFTQQHLVQPAP